MNFDGNIYEQCDGVAIVSPLGSTLANVFICQFEDIWLENCPVYLRPIIYRWLVDDTCSLFRTKNQVERLKNYLKKQPKCIKFKLEIEDNGSLSFLDLQWPVKTISL